VISPEGGYLAAQKVVLFKRLTPVLCCTSRIAAEPVGGIMKAIAKPFRGVFCFLVTPSTDDGERVDEARLRALIDEQIAAGVHGVTVFGSTGANGSFTEEERKRVISIAVEHVAGRVPVVAGTGSMTTAETIRLSKYAADKGVDAVLVVPITYWPLKENEVDEHYTAIARAVDIPVGIYNNPTTTGTDIKPEQIARLAKLDTIAFVKESSSIIERIIQIHRLTDHAVSVVNGKDAAMLEATAVGSDGWFSGGCNLVPRECMRLYALATGAGSLDAARDYFAKLYPLFAMQSQKSTLRVVYTGMDIVGRSVGPPRRPLRYLTPEDRKALEQVLADMSGDQVRLAKSA
jgi:4-hydroxy-tetrahydrodipicolinate synthase